MKRFVLILALAAFVAPVFAATRYVSDDLTINMRTGMGNQYAITEILESGTPVEVLQADGKGYTLVRAPDGKQGWVLTRFLDNQPSARDRLATTLTKLDDVRKSNDDLQGKLQAALATGTGLKDKQTELASQNAALKSRLTEITNTAAHSIQIAKQNEQLKARVERLKTEQMRLQYENQTLQSRREGLKIGALILFAGVLVGLILPRLRVRRRRSAWESH